MERHENWVSPAVLCGVRFRISAFMRGSLKMSSCSPKIPTVFCMQCTVHLPIDGADRKFVGESGPLHVPCKLPEQHGAAVQSTPYDSTQHTQRAAQSIRSSKQRANNSREQPTAESSRATMRAFATALAVFIGTGVQAQGPGGFGGGVFGGTGRAWTNDNFVPCTAGPDCGPFFAEAAEGSSNNK